MTRHVSNRLRFGLCLYAILLHSFSIGLAQKPQTRHERVANENLLKQRYASQRRLSFEPNQGQAEPRTRFLARGREFAISLNASRATVSFGNAQKFNLQFIGANQQARAIGEEKLSETTNYFIGNNKSDFHTNIPHYAKARFKQVYHGVDVVYHGEPGRLKYDIIVGPGADPEVVRIRYTGIESMNVDRDGNLELTLTAGSVVQPRPVIYQSAKGERRYVSGDYVIHGKNQIGFRLGNYDRNLALVIDPVLVFATYLGGGGADESAGVATDFEGNAYVVGTTNSLNFPTSAGAVQPTGNAGKNVFVTKLNANGSGVVYSTYLGGSLDDYGYSIAVDDEGNAYMTGTTLSTNYPTTAGALQTSKGGEVDAFVVKLNKTGSALLYSTYLGGAANEEGFGITANPGGNAFVTGVTASNNFIVTSGAMQTTLAGPTDAFVTSLNPIGSGVNFSTLVGGSGADIGFGIALDQSSNNAIITGLTDSINFPTTAGAFRNSSAGRSDAFVVKLNDLGSASSYATLLGGSNIDAGLAIAVDASGSVYVNGLTDSLNFPTTTGSLQPLNAGGESDAFVTKLAPSGGSLVYSTYLGGSGSDTAAGIALGFGGKAVLSGTTNSNNFPVTSDATQALPGGGRDAFLSKLLPDGSGLIYSSWIGGAQSEEAFGVAVDTGANAYVAGITTSSNFPTSTGALQTTGAGNSDGFVVKLGPGSDSPVQLLADTSGPAVDQAAGLESLLLMRDPFPFINNGFLNATADKNTRVVIFLANLQLLPGETASSVAINLIDGNNHTHDLAAEDVRRVPNLNLTQVTFRLPDNISPGTCTIRVKVRGQTSNAGTIRIKS